MPDDPAPDPSALPKPPHEPPHDRFFEEGEEPPARYDLQDVAEYHFDLHWKVTVCKWLRVARKHYQPFMKRSFLMNLVFGPGWLLAFCPIVGYFFMFLDPIGCMWLTSRALELITGRKIPTKGMQTYGALVYLDICMAIWLCIGAVLITPPIIAIVEFLERDMSSYAISACVFLALDVIFVLAVRGRLTRFAAILIVDQGLTTRGAIYLSWRMWKGRFWRLLGIELVTVVAELFGVAAAWLGIVFVRPFTTLVWSAAYASAIGGGLSNEPGQIDPRADAPSSRHS